LAVVTPFAPIKTFPELAAVASIRIDLIGVSVETNWISVPEVATVTRALVIPAIYSASRIFILRAIMPPLVQHQEFLTRVSPLVVSLAFIISGVVLWTTGTLDIESVGYASIWLLAFIGAALLFVPAGALAAVCVAATVDLNPFLIAVVAGSAEALGELTGYLAGMGGKAVFDRNRFYLRFKNLFSRYAGLMLFFGSIVPNPLFDIMGIAAGSILYPVRRFVLIVFVAKSIKFTWIALGCYWGGEIL
jgi:membrane protein YqaA with SNARE-associated domain